MVKSIVCMLLVLFCFTCLPQKCFGDASDLFNQADSYIKAKNYQQAETVYKSIIQQYPGADNALIANSQLAVMYISQRRNNEISAIVTDMIGDFPNEPNLSKGLYVIARRYSGAQNYAEAKWLYQNIIARDPNSAYAVKSAIDAAKIDIFVSIENNNDIKAQPAIDKLAADFSGKPDVAAALYYIAEKYVKRTKYETAKSLYQKIIEQYPNSQYAGKARFNIARNNAILLIEAGKDTEADSAVDRLVADFASNSDLPKSLGLIAEKYLKTSKYVQARNVYQRQNQLFPNNPAVNGMDVPKVNIMCLIAAGTTDEAGTAFNKLLTDYAGNADLPEAAYEIGRVYEKSRKYSEALSTYGRIISLSGENSIYGRKAQLGISRVNIAALITSGQDDKVAPAVDKMIIDFTGNVELPSAIYVAAETYYSKSYPDIAAQKAGLTKAVALFERVINGYPSHGLTPRIMLCGGLLRQNRRLYQGGYILSKGG